MSDFYDFIFFKNSFENKIKITLLYIIENELRL